MFRYLTAIDDLAHSDRFAPYWGWHDDHRGKERTAEYRPALQQVRAEFGEMFKVILDHGLAGGSCLQLGLGHCRASHEAFKLIFDRVITVDKDAHGEGIIQGDTHDPQTLRACQVWPPFDFLFIDAGHKFIDAMNDYSDYGPLVRSGGIIAFHDAAKRPGYETEIEVWQLIDRFRDHYFPVQMIGTEVGIAWMVKP